MRKTQAIKCQSLEKNVHLTWTNSIIKREIEAKRTRKMITKKIKKKLIKAAKRTRSVRAASIRTKLKIKKMERQLNN